MRARFDLAGSIMRANVRAYAALGAPVAAVIKNDGYGWGAARIIREIDDGVESYFVADETEFWAARMFTRRPIRLLAAVAPRHLAAVCAAGGIPNVDSRETLAAAAAHAASAELPVTVRIGFVEAAGWSAIRAAEAAEFGALCAAGGVQVELWTHITSATRRDADVRRFAACVAAVRSTGARVAGTDVASTGWAASELAASRLRIGAGLFGARLGGTVASMCAIRVEAPVVSWFAPGATAWAGYGDTGVPVNRGVAVVRCGYGDGFPKKLAGSDDILSVGMQYTTRLADEPAREYTLIGDQSDLDRLADRLGLAPQEFITGLAQHT